MAAPATPSTASNTVCDHVTAFVDEVDRLHSASPTPSKACYPTLDRPLAHHTWLTYRCVIVFSVLVVLLLLLLIILSHYCKASIPCQ